MSTPDTATTSKRRQLAQRTSKGATSAPRPSHPDEGGHLADRSAATGAQGRDADGATSLDGRRSHVIDRAADYASLADRGLTVARIARRRRKSTAYVSILLRLGRALQGLEPAEREAFRSPRITWSLVQRIVRGDTDVVSLRSQLRAALGGLSTHNVDRRRHRAGRARAAEPVVGAAWMWDASWFDHDPLEYAAAHLTHLTSVHHGIQSRVARAIAQRSTSHVAVGQSLRTLQRAVAAASVTPAPATATDRLVLATFASLDRKLAEAAAEIAALAAPGTGVRVQAPPRPDVRAGAAHPPGSGRHASALGADDVNDVITAGEIDDDLSGG